MVEDGSARVEVLGCGCVSWGGGGKAAKLFITEPPSHVTHR